MNLYSKYLICYDIENNKTRTKFFEKMKDFGLQPIQKSVFYGFLNQAEYNSVRRFAFELLKSGNDKCIFMKCDVSPKEFKQQFIGYDNFCFLEPDGYETI